MRQGGPGGLPDCASYLDALPRPLGIAVRRAQVAGSCSPFRLLSQRGTTRLLPRECESDRS